MAENAPEPGPKPLVRLVPNSDVRLEDARIHRGVGAGWRRLRSDDMPAHSGIVGTYIHANVPLGRSGGVSSDESFISLHNDHACLRSSHRRRRSRSRFWDCGSVRSQGGPLHRAAGNVFFISMLIMAVFAVYLAIVIPDQLVNVVIGTFVFYLIATAWMTVRRNEGAVGYSEKIGLLVILCLFFPFAILSFQLTAGLPPFLKSAVPLKGPVLIAIYVFTVVTATAAVSDLKVVLAGGILGSPAYRETPLAYVSRPDIGDGFCVHQRPGAASAWPLSCACGILLSAISSTGPIGLLDGSGAFFRLAQLKHRTGSPRLIDAAAWDQSVGSAPMPSASSA